MDFSHEFEHFESLTPADLTGTLSPLNKFGKADVFSQSFNSHMLR